MKLKLMATLMLATLLGTTAQAAESLNNGPYLKLKVLGNSGFVLNRLKTEDTKVVNGANMIIWWSAPTYRSMTTSRRRSTAP